MKFLFWNIKRKPLEDYIYNLVSLYKIYVVVLAESSIDPAKLLSVLNQSEKSEFHYASASSLCNKIHIFTKFSDDFMGIVSEDDRLTIRHLKLPGLIDILIAAVHFPDKCNWCDASQAMYLPIFMSQILRAEESVGHSRTVLVGDFNMNPFEIGVVGATGLHAVMSRKVAEKGKRTILKNDFKYFYNPMWCLFGDSKRGPPGTYYYHNSEPIEYFWHIFDQVLVRPELLDRFNSEDVIILDSDGRTSFLSKEGLPNKSVISDHLPILFKISL